MNRFIIQLMVFLIPVSSMAVIRYVTPAGAGSINGSSWANAAPDSALQLIIDGSGAGDEVWVACGVYVTTTGTNRAIAFRMRNNVAVYGGFQGNETALSQRVLSCGPCSVLTGEIGIAGNGDNSYHVINNGNLNNSALIDGFVIRDANDNRTATNTEGLGGGIYNQGMFGGNNSSPTIRNCIITNNSAVFGAGIFNNGSNGGISNPVISHCIITGNTATSGGGGIDNFGLAGNASPTLTNCLIYGNTALVAGGMYCWGGNAGGNSNPIILNCTFANNSATAGNAGGIICDNSDAAGPLNSGTSNPIVRNSIFWGNTASGAGPQFAIKGTGLFTATYSDINLTGQSGPHIISGAGTGNINSNPLYVNAADADGPDNCWMTNDDGLSVQNGSPVIDIGNNTGVPSLDIRFLSRINNITVDMGAYEYHLISLPVRFLNFYGNAINGFNRLQWNTADEMEGNYYEIQRSSNGQQFEKIGVRKNSTDFTRRYQFDDRHPLSGAGFYRVVYKSIGGTVDRFSSVIKIDTEKKSATLILQNNSAKNILILSPHAVHSLHLVSLSGANIRVVKNGNRLDYENVLPGIYLLRVQTSYGQQVYKVLL